MIVRENPIKSNFSTKSAVDNLFDNMFENLFLKLDKNKTILNIKTHDLEYLKSISLYQPITSCSTLVTNVMPFAVGRIYINLLSNKQLKKDVNEIVNNIKNEYISSISLISWMDYSSRINSINKIKDINFKIAYPDFILNDTYLNNLYKDVSY